MGSPTIFTNAWQNRPLNYFRALVLNQVIFAKQGSVKEIVHNAVDLYYKELITRSDLTVFATHALELRGMSTDDIKNSWRTRPGRPLLWQLADFTLRSKRNTKLKSPSLCLSRCSRCHQRPLPPQHF